MGTAKRGHKNSRRLKSSLVTREELLGRYISETGATVRQAAAMFGISKSTVHKDITEKLAFTNHTLYKEVKTVLNKNKSERHLRGGIATREKFEMIKELKNKTEGGA
jgi:putative DeoR family transcriptional regulator (stage III sporulation protein D)